MTWNRRWLCYLLFRRLKVFIITKWFENYSHAENEEFTGICKCPSMSNPENTNFVYMIKGKWHRLDGPAFECFNTENIVISYSFWIVDDDFPDEKYWNDPRVMQYNIHKKLKAINDYETV